MGNCADVDALPTFSQDEADEADVHEEAGYLMRFTASSQQVRSKFSKFTASAQEVHSKFTASSNHRLLVRPWMSRLALW